MFVQQMHFYNTVIEEISKDTQSIVGPNATSIGGNQHVCKERFSNLGTQGTEANINSNTVTSDEKNTCYNIKSFNEALDKLRKYECRALNLFR